MSARILIAGHSHIMAFGAPLQTASSLPELHPAAGDRPFDILTGPWPRNTDYYDRVIEYAAGRSVLLAWEGNIHNARFLFQPVPAFDFVCSTRPSLALDPSVQVVPELMVRSYFDGALNSLRNILKRLADIKAVGRTIVLATPPPKGNDDKLRAVMSRERHFVALAKQLNSDVNSIALSKPILRLKLWLLLQKMMREVAEHAGAHYLDPPPEAVDDDGFLKEEFWAPDATHANADYGNIVMSALQSRGALEPRHASL